MLSQGINNGGIDKDTEGIFHSYQIDGINNTYLEKSSSTILSVKISTSSGLEASITGLKMNLTSDSSV